MTDPKPKAKPTVATRTPGKKTAPGTFDRLRELPHPVDEFLNQTQPNPTQPIPAEPIPSQPIAPARDYNKRANSLERRALPSGLFPGTSKKLYDALYVRTRGAHSPARTIQATKRELMLWSGIKSKNTIAVNLQLLTANGLIRKQLEIGDHGGSVYEVFLPEEASQPNPTQPSPTYLDPTQKLGGDPTQKLGWDGSGKTVDVKEHSDEPKTSFKTKDINTDDEAAPRMVDPLSTGEYAAFAELLKHLAEASTLITGKKPSVVDAARWGELGELLITELRIAAGRTTVSSVPAFLAEHLRRRLWKKEKRQLDAETPPQGQGSAPAVDSKSCPDCFGTSMYYPEGFERGVARCPHKQLVSQSGGALIGTQEST